MHILCELFKTQVDGVPIFFSTDLCLCVCVYYGLNINRECLVRYM